MAQTKKQYVCTNCGRSSLYKFNICPNPDCKAQGSMREEIEVKRPQKQALDKKLVISQKSSPQKISEITMSNQNRWQISIGELNRVLGGGLVPGSLILLGGEPGIGKSSILLSASSILSDEIGNVLYVSGEESQQQIKMRASRFNINSDNLWLVSETNLETILEHVKTVNPNVLVIDSIQTVYTPTIEGSPGSVSQIRECSSLLQHLAKTTGIAIFIIGHITKDGAISGPKTLEHTVDTVLYLEGDQFQSYRILRSVKNRFGATAEIGVFEMTGEGLIEVPNPSEMFIAERAHNANGTAIAVTMEGTRPLLVEVQALTQSTAMTNPRRNANGIDKARLDMICAVMDRHCNTGLSQHDVFTNVVAGMKVNEPAIDLSIAFALLSSVLAIPIQENWAFVGEIGLSGELRSVQQIDFRIREAANMGFTHILTPKSKKLNSIDNRITVVSASKLLDAFRLVIPGA